MAPPLSAPQSDILMLEDEGELEPLVVIAGGEAGLTNIIENIMGGIVDNVGVEIQEGSGTVAPLRPATSSRPQTRGSVSGSLRSQSSAGTEQAREELAGIGGSVQDMVSGVITAVAGEFPSLPPSRPGTSGTGTVCACVRLRGCIHLSVHTWWGGVQC